MAEEIAFKGGDYFGISLDFDEYIKKHDYIDELWKNLMTFETGFFHKFVSLQIQAVAKSWHFSSDISVNEFMLHVWQM
jgi:glucan phosphorylase